jgi:hypothetical protein
MKKIILITLFSIGIYGMNSQNYTPCNPANECAGDSKKVYSTVLENIPHPIIGCPDVKVFLDIIECNGVKYANRMEWISSCPLSEQNKKDALASLSSPINYLMAGEELSIRKGCMKEITIKADNPNDPCWLSAGGPMDENHHNCSIDPVTGKIVLTGVFGAYVTCDASICCNYQYDNYLDINGNNKVGIVGTTTSGPCNDDGTYLTGNRYSKTFGSCNITGTIISEGACEAICTYDDVGKGWKMANAIKNPIASESSNYEFVVKGKTITLNNSLNNIKGLFVYDLNGKIVFSELKNFDQSITLNDVNSKQIYLVKVLLNNNNILRAKMYID